MFNYAGLVKIKKFGVLLMPIITAFVSIGLFFCVSLIPQSAIQEHAALSAQELLTQYQWQYVINHGDSTYIMDHYTDAQILMQSYNLTITDPASILSNPKHVSETGNMINALDEVVNQGVENEMNYVRYWMGFRIFVRPLLMVCSYFEMRKFLALCFFVIMVASLLVVSKLRDIKTALALGISVAFMNPSVISHSLQFSCCFMLSFVFLYVLLYGEKRKWDMTVLFCLFGTITQLFDFYTTPIITWGVPVLTLLVADDYAGRRLSTAGKTLLAWFYGYVCMWLLKLLLVSVFTDINGFLDGFASFAERIGIVMTEGLEDKYDVGNALLAVKDVAFPGAAGKLCIGAFSVAVLVKAILLLKVGNKRSLFSAGVFLLIAVVPFVWFVCTAQPTTIHAWFQYRSIVVTAYALLLFVFHGHSINRSQIHIASKE